MRSTRRLFLHNATFSAIAASVLPGAFGEGRSNGRAENFSQQDLAVFGGTSIRTFEPWIGSRFRVSLHGKPMGALVLLSVEDLIPKPITQSDSPATSNRIGPEMRPVFEPEMSSFALHFKGPATALPQDTYKVTHDWLGSFSLFLVPAGPSARRATCTAVFTLINKTLGPVKPK